MNRSLNVARVGLWAGPVFALITFFVLRSQNHNVPLCGMAATAIVMAIWWISAALPLAATSLVPIVTFPLFDVRSTAETAASYMNPMILLFLGGFLIAIGMQRWQLHHRIALFILARIGHKPQRIVLGFLVVSAVLSMWISNTATAMMMVAIGLAVIDELDVSKDGEAKSALQTAIVLAIAYGCSAGGIATLVGTPPNLVFASVMRDLLPGADPVTFARWMFLGVPIAIGVVVIVSCTLIQFQFRKLKSFPLQSKSFSEAYERLEPMSSEEKRVGLIFLCTGLLWVFRNDIPLDVFTIPGWSSLWAPFKRVDDGVVAIFMALFLFIIPSRSGRLLDQKAFAELPWSIVLLFSGGFALAGGFIDSGLANLIANTASQAPALPPFLVVILVCLLITFLTEVTSNTATAAIFLPLLASMAPGLGIDPLLLMIPATFAASMAFMLPVATPPNAIVFSSGKVTIATMAKTGVILNLLTTLWLALACSILIPILF